MPSYQRYLASRVSTGVANGLQQAIVSWQVYELSGDVLQLGIVGLFRFIPALLMVLIGGAVADAYDRRKVMLIAQTVPFAATAAMVLAIANHAVSLPAIYALVCVTGFASSFENPARQALLPATVPRERFMDAVTINSMLLPLALALGPALTGVLIWSGGVSLAYCGYLTLSLLSMSLVLGMRDLPKIVGGSSGVGWEAIREGISFVWHRPVIKGVMTLDMLATLFAGARALMPVYAIDILKTDALGYGVLAASMDAGAVFTSLVFITRPAPSRSGLHFMAAIAVFGLASMLFGLSTSLPLSVVLYGIAGIADQWGLIIRQNTIQLLTPDALRGRVSAVGQVFVQTANQVGAIESGLVAAATNAVFSVVSGGFICVAAVGLIAWRIPELWAYRASATSVPKDGVKVAAQAIEGI